MDKTLKKNLLLSILWLLGLLVLAMLSFQLLPKEIVHSQSSFFQSLSNWDGGHYLGIAQNGYNFKFQYAFFPLYPILIRVVSSLGISYLISGLIINILSFIGIIIIFTKLLKLDMNNSEMEKIIYIFLLFPASFFLITIYSEGLFLFLTLACFLSIRKGNFYIGTILALFCGVTRLVGLAVILGLWTESYLTVGFRKSWYVFLAPVGFLLYCFFLQSHTGDPLYFLSAENNWQRSLSLPTDTFWQSIQSLSLGISKDNILELLNLIFAVLGLGLALRSFRILRGSYAIYGLFAVLIPIFSGSLSSIMRFLLVSFPLFIVIAKFDKYFLIAYCYLCSVLLSFFVTLFINGYFAG